MRHRVVTFLSKSQTQVFIVLLAFLLSVWPFVAPANMESPFFVWACVYGVQVLFIGYLFVLSVFLDDPKDSL